MPTLQPLIVPWQISPSASNLGVTSKSCDGIVHGFVTFMGCLGEATQLNQDYGNCRQIVVMLEKIVSVRIYPDFSAEDSNRLDSYDWNAVLRFQDRENEFKNHYRVFHDQWNSTNVCPDPAAYIVEDSDWLRQLGYALESLPHLRLHHYLFIGNDFNVELIGSDLKWKIVGSDFESPK